MNYKKLFIEPALPPGVEMHKTLIFWARAGNINSIRSRKDIRHACDV